MATNFNPITQNLQRAEQPKFKLQSATPNLAKSRVKDSLGFTPKQII
jgi:hypothetical protein